MGEAFRNQDVLYHTMTRQAHSIWRLEAWRRVQRAMINEQSRGMGRGERIACKDWEMSEVERCGWCTMARRRTDSKGKRRTGRQNDKQRARNLQTLEVKYHTIEMRLYMEV